MRTKHTTYEVSKVFQSHVSGNSFRTCVTGASSVFRGSLMFDPLALIENIILPSPLIALSLGIGIIGRKAKMSYVMRNMIFIKASGMWFIKNAYNVMQWKYSYSICVELIYLHTLCLWIYNFLDCGIPWVCRLICKFSCRLYTKSHCSYLLFYLYKNAWITCAGEQVVFQTQF